MNSHRPALVGIVAALATAAATALPALGDDPAPSTPPDTVSSETAPPPPTPAPGETSVPPAGNDGEDDLPQTSAERQAALDHLNTVVACVRAKGESIPDPVMDADGGVHVSWDGPPRPAIEAAIQECDQSLN